MKRALFRATLVGRYDELVVSRTSAPIDDVVATQLLTAAWRSRERSADDARLINRLRFAQVAVDVDEMIAAAAQGARSLADVHLGRALRADVVRILDRDAPDLLQLPSGRSARLEYQDDGTIGVAAKLQELFGLGETPRIGPRRDPVVLSLLAPNGRPVQVTRDLKSFWDRTYPEVRKNPRGRYPKHPWPEDPWNAVPTVRTTRRRR